MDRALEQVDLRRLAYVLAIVDCGGFSAAANRLGVSQPSVSRAVTTLEHDLGAALFERVGRKVHLTAAGHALLGPARRMLREAQVAVEAVDDVRGLAGGQIHVVTLPTLAGDPLAGLIGEFRQRHPKVAIRILEADTADRALSMLTDGGADVGLAELPFSYPTLTAAAHFDQELFVAAPAGTPLPEAGVTAAELAAQPLIAAPPGASTRRHLEAALAAAGTSPTVLVETAQRDSIADLVLAGAGFALLPEPTARRAANHGAAISPMDPPLIRRLAVIHRLNPSPATQAFVAIAAASTTNAV
jgi:DNA-binding transcriptional LysR family regulator